MNAPHYTHACRLGGPRTLPVTWDRVQGGGRVACPICGASKLTAAIRGNAL